MQTTLCGGLAESIWRPIYFCCFVLSASDNLFTTVLRMNKQIVGTNYANSVGKRSEILNGVNKTTDKQIDKIAKIEAFSLSLHTLLAFCLQFSIFAM